MEVNFEQMKTNLKDYIDQVQSGEEIVIEQEGKPVARLVPYEVPSRQARVPGLDQGLVQIGENFDAPLPGELGQAFGL